MPPIPFATASSCLEPQNPVECGGRGVGPGGPLGGKRRGEGGWRRRARVKRKEAQRPERRATQGGRIPARVGEGCIVVGSQSKNEIEIEARLGSRANQRRRGGGGGKNRGENSKTDMAGSSREMRGVGKRAS